MDRDPTRPPHPRFPTSPTSRRPAAATRCPSLPDQPGHDDPLVGQNKAVDPNDKAEGSKARGTLTKKPKITGVYGDVPNVKGINPQGDPAEISPDPDTPPPAPQVFPQPPGPPPAGKVWNPIIGAWESYKPQDPPLTPSSLPPAPPQQPGDYNAPADDSANA